MRLHDASRWRLAKCVVYVEVLVGYLDFPTCCLAVVIPMTLAGTGAQEYERAIRLDSRGNSLRSLSASISPFRYKESWDDGCRVVAARCLCFPRSCLALRGSKSCVSSNRLELLYNLPD